MICELELIIETDHSMNNVWERDACVQGELFGISSLCRVNNIDTQNFVLSVHGREGLYIM